MHEITLHTKIIIFNKYLIGLLFFFCFFSCSFKKEKETKNQHEFTNELINETSPYLFQYAYNPVNWQAWNPETLKQAKTEKKLIIISVVYSACHWCHVMEDESFKNDSVVTLNDISALYKEDPEKIIDFTTKLTEDIKNAELIILNTDDYQFNC